MTEMVLNTTALPETLFRLIQTKKVRVKEIDGMIQLMPVRDNDDYTMGGLRGMFTGDPNMTVAKFLERKRADEELER